MYADYVLWGGGYGSDGQVYNLFNGGVGFHNKNGHFWGGIGQHNVGLTYRENVALWCECGIPAAEWLDSSTVAIAQLANTADESILCMRGGDAALPNYFGQDLLLLLQLTLNSSSDSENQSNSEHEAHILT